ncbi:hypothetical protein H2200_007948 [Cladophialophora chaetospira]|uniref:Uncharacterized protein n=1 Tax=Cladophialophora chaetospira TaxID=386627 RepID=A0AA38X6T1_9EURO|nr:hypothetical protein H2200_007948 [Cladophialophora chaetospira]
MSGTLGYGVQRDKNSRGKLQRPRGVERPKGSQTTRDIDPRAGDSELTRTQTGDHDGDPEDVDTLRLELQAKERDFEELSKQLTQMTARLLQYSQAADHLKLDDAHFQNAFDGLVYKVNNWTALNFTTDLTARLLSSTSKPVQDPFNGVYADWKWLISTSETRLLVIQEFTWNMFYTKLFSMTMGTGAFWAGDMRPAFLQLNDGFDTRSLSARDYHQWRSQTARMIPQVRRSQAVDSLKTKFSEEICNSLQELLNSAGKKAAWRELQSIVDDAVQLDWEMKTQVADYFIFWEEIPVDAGNAGPTSTGSHRSDGREGDKNDEPLKVWTTPGLKKRGESSGTGYDVEKQFRLPQSYLLVRQESNTSSGHELTDS